MSVKYLGFTENGERLSYDETVRVCAHSPKGQSLTVEIGERHDCFQCKYNCECEPVYIGRIEFERQHGLLKK